jgi:hypothetical protein
MFVEPVAGAIVGKLWDERRLLGAFVKDFCDLMIKGESWPRESEQGDKWSFCLTAGKMSPRIRRDNG